MKKLLGISAFYHDSAAALVVDGKITAAAQEERFTRKRHDAGFPVESIRYVLAERGITLGDLDAIVFYDKPLLKFDRILETVLAFAPRGFRSFQKSMLVWLKEKLQQRKLIEDGLKVVDPSFKPGDRLLFSEHHVSHAASAFFPSPFESAAVLTMDGVGEWATTSWGVGSGSELKLLKEIHFPHSLGLLYSAMTYYTGFKVNSGEYKVMGLAPYGEPKYASLIRDHLIDIREDGSFWLNQEYFDYCHNLRMTNDKFHQLFGGPPRNADEPLTQKHMDLAASIQAVIEDAVVTIGRAIAKETKQENLCMAGGVALNCVANGKLLKSGVFKNIWVQPASGDAGGAIGAALAAYHSHFKQPRVVHTGKDAMDGSYLGPKFSSAEVQARLKAAGAAFEAFDSDEEVINATAQAIQEGKAIGWFQGRMEFGPRALGNRSIIADARNSEMQRNLNLKVKFRESFRPFAPAVMREEVGEWFEFEVDSPYMLMVSGVNPKHRKQETTTDSQLFGIERLNRIRSEIPSVTHVDYSARIQTVHEDTNPKFHKLLGKLNQATACPVVVNTSFNVRGEPIVCTPEDAFRCFMGTNIDVLVVENCVLRKTEQKPELLRDYKNAFELD